MQLGGSIGTTKLVSAMGPTLMEGASLGPVSTTKMVIPIGMKLLGEKPTGPMGATSLPVLIGMKPVERALRTPKNAPLC